MDRFFHESWHPHLREIFENDKNLKELKENILPNCQYYPSKENIFRVFEMSLYDINLVILGYDPYPNGYAIGYSFLVEPGTKRKPFSLKIIEEEFGKPIDNEDWFKRGVFCINTALTVEARKTGSHTKYWSNFIIKVISVISKENPCEWLLMGRNAQAFIPNINNETNKIYCTPHPAAEGYSGRKAGFLGSGVFNKIKTFN